MQIHNNNLIVITPYKISNTLALTLSIKTLFLLDSFNGFIIQEAILAPTLSKLIIANMKCVKIQISHGPGAYTQQNHHGLCTIPMSNAQL